MSLHHSPRRHSVIASLYAQMRAAAIETDAMSREAPHRHVGTCAFPMDDGIEKTGTRTDMASRILFAVEFYETRPCFGTREKCRSDPNMYTDSYSWQTFKTVGDRIKNFSAGVSGLMRTHECLAICAASRPEWIFTDLACLLQSIVTIPIHYQLSHKDLAHIINNTCTSVAVCDLELLPKFIELQTQCPTLRHLICMDAIPDSILNSDQVDRNECFSIHSMESIETVGSNIQQRTYISNDPDHCVTIIYTSGSSGFPKGAMLSERCYRATFPSQTSSSDEKQVRLCYRPLAWITDRKGVIATFLKGGSTGFSSADVAQLMVELTLVAPTFFSAPPAVWNKIYSEYIAALATCTVENEESLLAQFSTLIPAQCKVLSIGGAMVSPAVLSFIRSCFRHCQVIEAYGATECGRIAFNNNFLSSMIEYRLESIPDMGYTFEDQPYPRGELLVKTTQMFSGYMNNAEETSAALTYDGFFRTGDIVELRHSNHGKPCVYVIDRKKNFFKLAQGQFVSPEYLESVYSQSLFVQQIYVCGDGLDRCVKAVVVPNNEYAQRFAIRESTDVKDPDSFKTLLRNAILHDLQTIAAKECLRKHEIPVELLVEFQPFTSANGLLTLSMKLCRPKLTAYYADQFKERKHTSEQLRKIIERVTGHELSMDANDHLSYAMGADSLAGLRLSHMIRNDLDVQVPLKILFNSNLTVQQLVDFVHDPSQRAHSAESIVSRLLYDADFEQNLTIGKRRDGCSPPTKIFITGATGYVGAYLLVELMKTQPADCKFVCLVRCSQSTDALERIRQQLRFLQLWHDGFAERIIAVRGDLAQNHFGLDDTVYEDLASNVSVIFHCAALVHFLLPYSALYEVNVCGTREIIRFACHSLTCIPIHYISTMSVRPSGAMSASSDSPHRLKNGYAQSKWVAEQLITRAHQAGLPVVIYRLGSMGAHTETGACNRHDFNTLLTTLIMKVGCYSETIADTSVRTLPIDEAMRRISSAHHIDSGNETRIYEMENQSDPIPLRSIIEGMHTCGLQVECVTEDVWLAQLESLSKLNKQYEGVCEFFTHHTFQRHKTSEAREARATQSSPTSLESLYENYIIKWLRFIMMYILEQRMVDQRGFSVALHTTTSHDLMPI